MNPCGNSVPVSWPVELPSNSVYSKATKGWLVGANRRQKKVSFKSRLYMFVYLVTGDVRGCVYVCVGVLGIVSVSIDVKRPQQFL